MKKKLNCILLIDDDEPTNFLNKMILEDMACCELVVVAQGGPEAIDYLTRARLDKQSEEKTPMPDLIFLDINMPAMDGWEFLEIFRMIATNGSQKTVLVMLTTSLNPDDEIKSTKIAEVTAYKNKPLSKEMMEGIIAQHFKN